MNTKFHKFMAVIEVTLVTLVLVSLATLATYRIFPSFETWQTRQAGFVFPVFVDVVMVVMSLLLLSLRGISWASAGICFKPLKYHLDLAATCFVPFVLAGMPIGLGLDFKSWVGALVLSGVQVVLLLCLAFLTRRQPNLPAASAAFAVFWLANAPGTQQVAGELWKTTATFLTYALFVGFGEEILYRGYAQTRLNLVFKRPFSFAGVPFGWGSILAALIFGLSHTGLTSLVVGVNPHFTPAWGLWTFFGGLVFAFVREKSGSILAPALLHGLPQAIASVFFLLSA